MKEFFEHMQRCLTKIIILSREEWVNLILYWVRRCEGDINPFSIALMANCIKGEMLEYMRKNKIDFIRFVDFYNEDELRLKIQEKLGYQLKAKAYNRKVEMIDLSRNATIEICKELKISHDEWTRWINKEFHSYPLKIAHQTFWSAIDFIAERIFQNLDMLHIDFLTFMDHEGKEITIPTIKDKIDMHVEIELANQLDQKYGKI
jgi:hypothetical protein